MASLNIMKMKAGELGGLGVHLGEEKRRTLNHANKDINPAKTLNNFCVNCENFSDGLKKINKIIKETDEAIPPKRKVKDRVTTCACEFKIPKEISDKGMDKAFAEKTIEFLKKRFGVPEMIGFVHLDEKHKYIDALTHEETESLNHIHAFCPAYTSDKGINGKAFFNLEHLNFRDINKEFDEFVFKEFGIHYLNANKTLGLDVETLKTISNGIQEHDLKLESRIDEELKFHRELINKGKDPEVEIKEKHNEIRMSKDDYEYLINDFKHVDAFKKEFRMRTEKLQIENAELKREYNELQIQLEADKKQTRNVIERYERNVEAYSHAVKALSDKYGEDYNRIENIIMNCKNFGTLSDIDKKINPMHINANEFIR